MDRHGKVDEEGRFYFLHVFKNNDSEDMDEMMKLYRDEELDPKIIDYDEYEVKLIIYPGFPVL